MAHTRQAGDYSTAVGIEPATFGFLVEGLPRELRGLPRELRGLPRELRGLLRELRGQVKAIVTHSNRLDLVAQLVKIGLANQSLEVRFPRQSSDVVVWNLRVVS